MSSTRIDSQVRATRAQSDSPARSHTQGPRPETRHPAPTLEDPAELEQLAATVLVALEQAEPPAAAVVAVLAGIEARRDPDAAGVLAAIAVLAGEPLAAQARAGTEATGSSRQPPPG